MSDNNKKLNRRQFLKMTGIGSASAVAMLAMRFANDTIAIGFSAKP